MGFFTAVPSVTVVEAEQKMRGKGAILVDVRNPDEFAAGHARGAENCPLPVLGSCVDKLKGYSEVYVICQSGGRSASAVSSLLSENVRAYNVSGGTSAWRANGLPVA